MNKYRKVIKPKEALVKDDDEIRVTAAGSVSAYVSRAAKLFNEMEKKCLTITATGNALTKAVTAAEVIKRRFQGLHQITKLDTQEIVDEYEPIEEGLDKVTDVRHVPCMVITLSKDALDTSDKGYQEPLDPTLVVEVDPEEMAKSRGRGAGRGKGRGKGAGKTAKGKGKGKADASPPKGKGKGKGKAEPEPAKGKGKGKGKGKMSEPEIVKGKGKSKGKADLVPPKGKSKGKGKEELKGKGKGKMFEPPKGKSKGKGWDSYDAYYEPPSKGKAKGKGKDFGKDMVKGKGKGKDFGKDSGKGKSKGKGKGGKGWH